MNVGHRVLIVDNYDSFTYNLVHYVHTLVGGGVKVVKNDDTSFEYYRKPTELFLDFDLIILSPGPGDPEHDCGCITEFVLDAYFSSDHNQGVPVLFGVCMGFEAIGVRLGIPLIRLVPRHGMKWKIFVDHAKDDHTLFKNLPDVIEQVRYHSLTLCPKTLLNHADLIVTSSTIDLDPSHAPLINQTECPRLRPDSPEWRQFLVSAASPDTTPDLPPKKPLVEIPMSFRHRVLPIYATQFHPESILSEHGFKILENLCKSLVGWRQSSPRLPRIETCSQTRTTSRITSVVKRMQIPLSQLPQIIPRIFRTLYRKNCANIWLDSPPKTTGKWSIIPDLIDETRYEIYSQQGPLITDKSTGRKWEDNIESFISATEKRLKEQYEVTSLVDTAPICAPSIFTVLGYEAAKSTLERSEDDLADAIVIVAHRIVAVDNTTGEVLLTCLPGDEEWIGETGLKIETLVDAPSNLLLNNNRVCSSRVPEFSICDSKECYIDKIRACQLAIANGESYELCLTTQINSVDDLQIEDPLALYELMRIRNPAPYSAYIEIGGREKTTCILSVSPELLLHVTDGVARVKPIKGTRPRGATVEKDEAIKKELGNSEKDIAENLMIVDLVRNDLSRVCNEVTCPILMNVETFAPYHQLISTVEGKMDDDRLLSECLFGLFPAGSMTGAPKIRSIEILAALEGRKRGIGYSGSIGYISPVTRSACMSVVIRTVLLVESNRPGFFRASIGCGGAILGISNPTSEWSEMLTKSRPNLAIIGEYMGAKGVNLEYNGGYDPPLFIHSLQLVNRRCLVETMRCDERGIWLFDRHVDRLFQSLDWMGYDMSRDRVREKLIGVITDTMPRDSAAASVPLTDVDGLLEKTCSNDGDWFQITSVQGSWRVRIEVGETWDAKWTPLEPIGDPPCLGTNVRVDSTQQLLRHKIRDWVEVVNLPKGVGRNQILLVNELGEVTETGVANVALRQDGGWITPSKSCGLLPGTLRSVAIERGLMKTGKIFLQDVLRAQEILCFNSVRGFWLAKVE